MREINFSFKLIAQLNEYNFFFSFFFFLYEINQVLFFIWLRKDSSLIEDCVYLFRINFFLLLLRLLILRNLYSLLINYQINQKKKKRKRVKMTVRCLSRYISLFLIQRWKEEKNCTCVVLLTICQTKQLNQVKICCKWHCLTLTARTTGFCNHHNFYIRICEANGIGKFYLIILMASKWTSSQTPGTLCYYMYTYLIGST